MADINDTTKELIEELFEERFEDYNVIKLQDVDVEELARLIDNFEADYLFLAQGYTEDRKDSDPVVE